MTQVSQDCQSQKGDEHNQYSQTYLEMSASTGVQTEEVKDDSVDTSQIEI